MTFKSVVFGVLMGGLVWITPLVGPVAAADAGTLELAQSKVMQCMERCLRNEGKSERATCKSRCANVPVRRSGGPDCMGGYKQCLKPCGSDKSCKRACKAKLMTCS